MAEESLERTATIIILEFHMLKNIIKKCFNFVCNDPVFCKVVATGFVGLIGVVLAIYCISWDNLSKHFSLMGNPPALPGDLKSLTYAGVEESLSIRELPKVSDGEAFDDVCIKSMPYDVGLQVSHRVDSEVSSKSTFWQNSWVLRRNISCFGPAA